MAYEPDALEDWEKIPLVSPFNAAKDPLPVDSAPEPQSEEQAAGLYGFEADDSLHEFTVAEKSEATYAAVAPVIERLTALFADLKAFKPHVWKKAKTFFTDVEAKFSAVAASVLGIGYATPTQAAAIHGWYKGVHAWWPDWTIEKSVVMNTNKVKHLYGIPQLPWPTDGTVAVVPDYELATAVQRLIVTLLQADAYFGYVFRLLDRLATYYAVAGLADLNVKHGFARLTNHQPAAALALVQRCQTLGVASIGDIAGFADAAVLRAFVAVVRDDTPLWRVLKLLKLKVATVVTLKAKYGGNKQLKDLSTQALNDLISVVPAESSLATWLRVYKLTQPVAQVSKLPAAVPAIPSLGPKTIDTLNSSLTAFIVQNKKLYSFIEALTQAAGSGKPCRLYLQQDFLDSGYVQFQSLTKASRKLLYKWCKKLKLFKAATCIKTPAFLNPKFIVTDGGVVYTKSILVQDLYDLLKRDATLKEVLELYNVYLNGSEIEWNNFEWDEIEAATAPALQTPFFSVQSESLERVAQSMASCDLTLHAQLIRDRLAAQQQVQQQKHVAALVPRYRRRIVYHEESDET